MTWLAFALFVAASVYAFVRLSQFQFVMDVPVGPRTRRRRNRQLFTAVGLWQSSVGLVLVAQASWTFAIGVFGVALLMFGQAWLIRRHLALF